MRPTSVVRPVAVTTALPTPAATVVPLYAMFLRSASGVSSGSARAACFEEGSDSPVSAASFVRKSVDSITRASAGT